MQPQPEPTKRQILILSSNPKNTPRVRLEEEVREIQAALRRGKNRDDFAKVTHLPALRVEDFRDGLLDEKPEIVHFCGHGSGPNGLAVEDDRGRAFLVRDDALATLFGHFSATVKCVVLNACLTKHQADEIAKHIDYVIGMGNSIDDKAAV